MKADIEERLIACAASLAEELEREIAVPSELLDCPERDAGYRLVHKHEEEIVTSLAAWLAELPPPDYRTAPPPVGADPLISLNLGELLANYGYSAVYLIAEAVLRLYRPYLIAAMAASTKGGAED